VPLAGADKLVISGRHRFIADYLSEDVLAHLSDSMRQFLLQTSILDRLCGSLCDAVAQGENGQEMLEQLERDNLFLREELHRRHPDIEKYSSCIPLSGYDGARALSYAGSG
jgi:ATP/maltotriose-dependent transcriptional regulator MalT